MKEEILVDQSSANGVEDDLAILSQRNRAKNIATGLKKLVEIERAATVKLNIVCFTMSRTEMLL